MYDLSSGTWLGVTNHSGEIWHVQHDKGPLVVNMRTGEVTAADGMDIVAAVSNPRNRRSAWFHSEFPGDMGKNVIDQHGMPLQVALAFGITVLYPCCRPIEAPSRHLISS